MKPTLITLTAIAAATFATLHAQYYPAAPSPAAPAAVDPAQVDQLVSPIALYPDPLLSAMLPASTHVGDVVAAASFLQTGSDPSAIDQQPWDESVKIVAHYPNVLLWMAQNEAWTAQLGATVATDSSQVLDSVQRLRANAREAGLLVDSPQQQIVTTNNVISIEPSQSGTLYVPIYDPEIIITNRPPERRFALTFSSAYPVYVGPRYSVDWRARSFWIEHNSEMRRSGPGTFASSSARSRQQWRPASPAPARSYPYPYHAETWSRNRAPQPTRYSEHAGVWQAPGVRPTGRVAPAPSPARSRPSDKRPADDRRDRDRDRNDDDGRRRDDGAHDGWRTPDR